MTCLLSAIVVAYAAEDVVSRALSSVEQALANVGGASEAIVVLNRRMDEVRRRFSESWIVVSDGMRLKPDKNKIARSYGACGATFLARVGWE